MKHPFLLSTFLMASVATATAQQVSVARFLGDRACAISLTYDDGLMDDYTLIAPHMERYGLHGTFTINCAFLGDLDDHYSPRLTAQQVRELHERGHEISNHSWSHPNLTRLSDAELQTEILRNDSAIEALTGQRPLTFIYPYNAWDERVKAACSQGRVGIREYQLGLGQFNSHATAESIQQWLRQQIDGHLWGVTMTHGIYAGWDTWSEPWVLWDFYRELAYKGDTIWTDTFAEVSKYVTERDSIQLRVEQKRGVFTITPSLNLDPQLFDHALTLRFVPNAKGVKPVKLADGTKVVAYRAMQDGRTLPLTLRDGALLCDFSPYAGPITIEPLKADPLQGKKVCILGDSYVQNHRQSYENAWHYKVAARHGMTYKNYGRNGGAIAFDRTNRNFGKALYVRYTEMDDDADYVIVVAGHNDAYFVTESADSLAAFREHVEDLCAGLRQKYPTAQIAFVSPWNVAYAGFPVVMGIIREACQRHGFPYLDAAATSGIRVEDEEFRRQYFQAVGDHAHLNPAGHDLLIGWGETFLMSL